MAKAQKPPRPVPGAPKFSDRKRSRQPTRTRKGANQNVPGKPENMTPKRWADYLQNIANGMSHRDASHAVKLTMQTVDAYLISNVAATQQLRDAKLLWNRRDWPMHRIEDVLEQIALGKTLKEAFNKLEIPQERRGSLYAVLLQDKAIRKLYDDARELQMESFSDEIIEIADETSNDWTEDGRGNPRPNAEVVNRSRVRIDTRKFLMGSIAAKRFGSTKHHVHEGELNINHAAILTGGRRRLEKLHEKRKGVTIEGAVEVDE